MLLLLLLLLLPLQVLVALAVFTRLSSLLKLFCFVHRIVLSAQVTSESAAARVEAEAADSTMTDSESMRLEEKLRQFQIDMATEKGKLLF